MPYSICFSQFFNGAYFYRLIVGSREQQIRSFFNFVHTRFIRLRISLSPIPSSCTIVIKPHPLKTAFLYQSRIGREPSLHKRKRRHYSLPVLRRTLVILRRGKQLHLRSSCRQGKMTAIRQYITFLRTLLLLTPLYNF